MEYDKLANEKTEMQRHYVMVRTGVVELGVGFTAAPSMGASGEKSQVVPPHPHQLCRGRVSICFHLLIVNPQCDFIGSEGSGRGG